MTTAEVLLHYQQRLAELQSALAAVQTKQWGTISIIAIAATIAIGTGILAYSRRTIPAWYPPLALPPILISLRGFGRRKAQAHSLSRLREHYEKGETRLEGNWPGQGEPGNEYNTPGHPYASDLNLFGTGSLFERLCTARTQLGRERLAQYIKSPATQQEALERQTAVQELVPNTHLRESITLLGKHSFEQLKPSTFPEWLNIPFAARSAPLRTTLHITSSVLLALTLALMLVPSQWRELAIPMLALATFHTLTGTLLLKKVRAIIEPTTALITELGVVREGLSLLSAQAFTSPKLQHLTHRATGAAKLISQLDPYLFILEQRSKDSWYPLSLWLLLGTQSALAIDAWRSQHKQALLDWLDAWAEFEALNALACYAHENPEDSWPTIQQGPATFEAHQLSHPLIPRETCVSNDVSLGSAARMWVISGSNMAGKSTLLRSIGLASVLALAGAPVRAKSLTLSAMRTCASISLTDSLSDGKSRFMAEVERLRDTLEAAVNNPVLFLIDEIFSGTNSEDRRAASDAVVRTLIDRGAIGLVSTHDIALASLAHHRGENKHMASRGQNPLDFDYLLKPGVTPQTNALAIARLAGVPV